MTGRTHRYEVTVRWTGNTGSGTSGYKTYKRDHEIASGVLKQPILGSSDPAFRGDPARWNPEELRVTFVPSRKPTGGSEIEVGRISLYYR